MPMTDLAPGVRPDLRELLAEMRSAVRLSRYFDTPPIDAQGLSDWCNQFEAALAALPPPADPPRQERLRALARAEALKVHWLGEGNGSVSRARLADGHSEPFGACAHPDCVLVRDDRIAANTANGDN